MESAYIGIGSNIGRKIDHCKRAISLMGRLEGFLVRELAGSLPGDGQAVESYERS